MSSQDDFEAVAPAPRPDSGLRLKRWAARRGRQLAIVGGVVLGLLVVAVVSGYVQRKVALFGLPDVGDPFDVTEFLAERVPNERNAFDFYRRASERLDRESMPARPALNAIPSLAWSQVDPKVRPWADANREALSLFRAGTEQADGWAHPVNEESTFLHERFQLGLFLHLALLEASRLEEEGDMPGAWAWYQSLLAMHAHIMRRGNGVERMMAGMDVRQIAPRVLAWAKDPRTRPVDIRRALDESAALEPRPEWEASSLKVDYLLVMRELDHPERVLGREERLDPRYRMVGELVPPNLLRFTNSVRRYLIGEPERSKRVVRLVFANRLAQVQSPDAMSRKPTVRARFAADPRDPGVLLYAPGASAAAAARALSPQELARWLTTSPDAKMLAHDWRWLSLSQNERAWSRAVVTLLAGELFRRDKGRPPAADRELIGAYVDHLPDDSSALDDIATTIEEVAPERLEPEP